MSKNIGKEINELFSEYRFGRLIGEPKPITGGLLHKMYQVTTDINKYAVKELNPAIMKREGVVERIIHSERIVKALDRIIPAIPAIWVNNNPLLTSGTKYYMIFEWLDGTPKFPPDITVGNCAKIGMLLAKVHTAGLQISGIDKENANNKLFDWDKYLRLGQKTGAVWMHEFIQWIDQIKRWNQASNEACFILNNHTVLSHKDLDPKNVIWKDNQPYIIDWESAGHVNPHQELLEVLTYWTNDVKNGIDENKFKALYHAYIEIAKICQVDWESVLASAYAGMLGWLDYSFKRSLEIECSSLEEMNSGTKQVFITIQSLKDYSQHIDLLRNWLN